jgi:hypothetical protein
MEEPVTLRPVFGRVLTILIWAIVGAVIIALVVAGDWVHLATAIAPLLLVAFATWMGFWAPCVKLSPAGVELVNVFRTRTVSWPAIQRIETKYSLTLYTKVGRFSAWAAPAPSRFAAMTASRKDLGGLPESTFSAENRVGLGDLPTSDSGLAALHVRRAWEGYRDAGLLGAVEGTGVKTRWHPVILVVLAVLVVGVILSITL